MHMHRVFSTLSFPPPCILYPYLYLSLLISLIHSPSSMLSRFEWKDIAIVLKRLSSAGQCKSELVAFHLIGCSRIIHSMGMPTKNAQIRIGGNWHAIRARHKHIHTHTLPIPKRFHGDSPFGKSHSFYHSIQLSLRQPLVVSNFRHIPVSLSSNIHTHARTQHTTILSSFRTAVSLFLPCLVLVQDKPAWENKRGMLKITE